MLLQRFLPRLLPRRWSPMFSSWTRIVLPALAVSLAAAAWLRRSDASHPMPRLPVRRKPPTPRGANPSRASRLRRLQAPAPEVALPLSFWDAEADEDDPAEIPTAGLSFVSEASQSAALLDPGELEESGSMLHW